MGTGSIWYRRFKFRYWREILIQYFDDIRLEAVGDYYFKSDGLSMFDININGHY